MDIRELLNKIEDLSMDNEPTVGDIVEIELGDTLVETHITEVCEDGVFVHLDETALSLIIDERKQLLEYMKMGADSDASASGSFVMGEEESSVIKHTVKSLQNPPKIMQRRAQRDKENVEKYLATQRSGAQPPKEGNLEEDIDEAKYQGREVPLGKPMAGDVKKSKVYVRGPKGNVVKVNFGDKKMRIKKSNPKRRKSFRARHNCANPGPRWKARYWSCRAW